MVPFNQISDQMIKYGLESFSDVDTLSILLGLKTNPRGRINQAKSLIDYCGDFNSVINAALENPPAIPKEYQSNLFGLRLPHEVTNRYLKSHLNSNPIVNDPEGVIKYLKHSMSGLPIEKFKVLYLNGQNRIITEEDKSIGTITGAAVYPREVIKSALRYNSSALILAHNHPSGNNKPSQDDIKITNCIYDAAKLFQISIHDHIIIAGNKHFSFSEHDLIPDFNIMRHVK